MKKLLMAGAIALLGGTAIAGEWKGTGQGFCVGSNWPFWFTASVSNGKLDGRLSSSSFDFPITGTVKDGIANLYGVGAQVTMLVMVDLNSKTVLFSADSEDCTGTVKIGEVK